MNTIKIATFYKFSPLSGLESLRDDLLKLCRKEGIKGTILIANEGLNATIAGPEAGVEALLTHLRKLKGFEELTAKFSKAPGKPFRRMKVRIKKEIVTLGIEGISPSDITGPHIPIDQWNEIISNPDTLLLDTRNDYETEVGTFKGALVPNLKSFRDFPKFVEDNLDPAKHKTIAMFCTGGIRCEKASAYMIQKGFKNVVQLDGGILNYLEKTPKDQSKWQGDCYVFDERMAVDEDLNPAGYTLCPTCRWPVSEEDKLHPDYEEGVTCKNCKHSAPIETIKASRERKKQINLAAKRGEKHLL